MTLCYPKAIHNLDLHLNIICIIYCKKSPDLQKAAGAAHVFSITDTKLSENNPLLLCAEVGSNYTALFRLNKTNIKCVTFTLVIKLQPMPKH